MTRDDFARLVGDRVAHCTAASNAASIAALGLLPAADLAQAGGVRAETLELRADPPRFSIAGRGVQLNHQKPLRMGRTHDFLDGHSLQSWSRQLDQRVFFWPHAARLGGAFVRSLGAKIVIYHLDALAFFDAFSAGIWLSPINSGSAVRKPARRGDWLYVSAANPPEAFTLNRVRRGLVRRPDRVAELSIRQPVPPDLLARLRSDP